MSQAYKFLSTSDVLSSRHPYAQPAFTGCQAGNANVDPLEVSVAFGRASVPKLADVIALGAQITAQPESIDATEVEGVMKSTEAALRVLYEELARQEARAAAVKHDVAGSLSTLLERPETVIKEFAAKCLERLATLVQGRRLFSRGGYAIVRGLVGLLQDEADSVNLSAMSALRMLSESRDGCDLLLAADSIPGLVSCLSEMKRAPILLGEALFSLGNLTKMVEAIQQAMEAGAVDRLVALLAEGEETSGVQMRALVLKCVWNIANLDEGKEATIKANGVAQIAPCLSSADEDIRRLAVGALLALLVDQAGKTAAIDMEMRLVEPLVTLLDDESEETRVNVVAVIRSICDHPAGRAQFSRHEVAVSQQWMDLFPSVMPS